MDVLTAVILGSLLALLTGIQTWINNTRFAEAKQDRTELKVELEAKITSQINALRHEMDRRFEAVDQRFEAQDRRVDDRFRAVDRRFEAVDQRFEAVDRRFDALDQRFEAVDRRFEAVQTELVSIHQVLAQIALWVVPRQQQETG